MNLAAQIQIAKTHLVLKHGDGSHDESDHGNREGGSQLSKDADAIAAMGESVRDNMELADFPGGAEAYNLYEARKMLPTQKETLKRVTDSNSFSLWQDYDAIANVSGTHFGVSKYEDPDEPDDDSKFVYAFRRLDRSMSMRETDTSDVRELFQEMRKNIK